MGRPVRFSDKMQAAFLPGSTFFRYVLLSVFVPFSMACTVILLALSLERLLRLMDLVSSEGQGISIALELLIYLQPHYLGLAIPAASFLAVLLVIRKFNDNAEFVIMQSSGNSPSRLLIPVGMFAVIMTLVMFLLVDMAQPHSRYAYRVSVQELKSDGSVFRVKPGVFQNIGKDTVIRAERVSHDGRSLYGVFANMRKSVDGKLSDNAGSSGKSKLIDYDEVIVIADEAVLRDASKDKADNGSKTGMTLYLSGAQIITKRGDNKPSLLKASQYPLQIALKDISSMSPRGENERELSLGELLDGGARGVMSLAEPPVMQAELHGRIVQALSVPVLIFLAVPLGLLGRGRTGQAIGIVIGLVILVLYEKMLGFSEAFAASGQVSVYASIWLSFLILVMLTLIFSASQLQIFYSRMNNFHPAQVFRDIRNARKDGNS